MKKKFIAVAMTLLVATFALAACGDDGKTTDNGSAGNDTTATDEKTDAGADSDNNSGDSEEAKKEQDKQDKARAKMTAKTKAVVAGNERMEDEDGNLLYYPVVNYQVDDQQYGALSEVGTLEKKYKATDEVTIRYNPESPVEFEIIE